MVLGKDRKVLVKPGLSAVDTPRVEVEGKSSTP